MNAQTSHIDWARVRTRLDESEITLQRAMVPEAERIQSVFHERALQMARTTREGDSAAVGCLVLIFSLGKQKCAVEMRYVAEVSRLPRCTSIPGGPPALLGVINHRGEVKSVIDLAFLLDRSPSSATSDGFFLLLQDMGRQLLVRVDQAEEVRGLDVEKLAAPPACGNEPSSRYVKGIHPDGTIVLNAEAILTRAARTEAA